MVSRKFRFKTLKIFLTTQNHFEKKKNSINREILLDTFEKKCKILVNKIINKSRNKIWLFYITFTYIFI